MKTSASFATRSWSTSNRLSTSTLPNMDRPFANEPCDLRAGLHATETFQTSSTAKMQAPLHKCMTKATTAEGDQMQYGPNWVLSRRAILKVFPDRLECGNWTIPYANISDAVLYSIRSTLFIPGYVLKVQTPDKTYHFGLNWGRFWTRELPFPVSREQGKLGYSKYSLLVRIGLLGSVGYLLWTWASR